MVDARLGELGGIFEEREYTLEPKPRRQVYRSFDAIIETNEEEKREIVGTAPK